VSDTKAIELGITPLARIVASGVSALNPEIMGLGDIDETRQALERARMTIDDVDLAEINEAFAARARRVREAPRHDVEVERLSRSRENPAASLIPEVIRGVWRSSENDR
jgi:acetyl-CoA C-acetyltransferase